MARASVLEQEDAAAAESVAPASASSEARACCSCCCLLLPLALCEMWLLQLLQMLLLPACQAYCLQATVPAIPAASAE
jgi:hypothetical protein